MKKNVLMIAVCSLTLLASFDAYAVGNLSNPLIRPSAYGQATAAEGGAANEGGRASQARPAEARRSEPGGGATPNAQTDEDLVGKAERRITQEDLNIRQQQLNSSVIPQPLEKLFDNMHVVAYFRGAVVLRKITQRISVESGAPREPDPSQSAGQNGGAGAARTGAAGGATVTTDSVSLGPNSVLRFNVGRVVSVNGYKLKASVTGQDVAIDWVDEKGRLINVYVGAIQSGSGVNPVPPRGALESVQTQSFQYLKPQVGGSGIGAGSVGGLNGSSSGGFGGQSGFGSSTGGNTGGFGGNTSGGFGSSTGGFGGNTNGFR